MSAIEDGFNPAALTRSDTLSSTITASKATPSAPTKSLKLSNNLPRIDFEPLYVELKSLIGHHWDIYHHALTKFLRGELSSVEFGDLTDNFLFATPTTEHAHNNLICAILHNTTRELPDAGPAAWVSATSDKASGASANKTGGVTSDAADQRLKVEIMALLPRDRRRIKGISTENSNSGNKIDEDSAMSGRRSGYEGFYSASRIKAPDTSGSVSAGGLAKTNWEMEIKKRYAQPLSSETLEFPDAATIYARMVPICYEESIAAGSSMQCAEMVAIAAEMYVKNFLHTVLNRTRSNCLRSENGLGNGVLTGKFKKQLAREESEMRQGKVRKAAETGLLPIEAKEAGLRRALGVMDLRLADSIGGRGLWGGMPLVGRQVAEAPLEAEQEEWRAERENAETIFDTGMVNGHADELELDDDDYGWEGTGTVDKEALSSLLDDCLAIRA